MWDSKEIMRRIYLKHHFLIGKLNQPLSVNKKYFERIKETLSKNKLNSVAINQNDKEKALEEMCK